MSENGMSRNRIPELKKRRRAFVRFDCAFLHRQKNRVFCKKALHKRGMLYNIHTLNEHTHGERHDCHD